MTGTDHPTRTPTAPVRPAPDPARAGSPAWPAPALAPAPVDDRALPAQPPAPRGRGSAAAPQRPRRRGLRLGEVPIRVTPGALLLALLLASSVDTPLRDATRGRPNTPLLAALDVTVAVLLLASVLLHEVAHALVARALGLRVGAVTLHAYGGATTLLSEIPGPREQYLVSVTGPLVNVTLGGVSAAVAHTVGSGPLQTAAGFLAAGNVVLAVFNLLPGLPLDGGQVLRAAVWSVTGDRLTGMTAAAVGGLVTAAATVALGAAEASHGGSGLGAVLAFAVALMIAGQSLAVLRSTQVTRRLPGLIAGQLARPAWLVQPGLPLAEALRRAEAARCACVLVGRDAPEAVVLAARVGQVPTERRPWVSVDTVARTLTPELLIRADTSGQQLLAAVRRAPSGEYVVVDGPHTVGVLQAADLATALEHPRVLARRVRRRARRRAVERRLARGRSTARGRP